MEEYQEFYSKIILIKNSEVDHDSLINGAVALEIDAAYSIGKSVAALVDGEVIGHLPRYVAKPIWLKLKFGFRIEATIYDSLENGFKNSICFSALSKSREIGVRIKIFYQDTYDGDRQISALTDAKLFLSFAMRHHLNSFPGVTSSNCPPELKYLV